MAQCVAGGLQARLHLCLIGLGSARLHLGIARDAPGGADQQVAQQEHFASPLTFFLMWPTQAVAPLCSYRRTALITETGRASWRESGWQYVSRSVVGGAFKKQKKS